MKKEKIKQKKVRKKEKKKVAENGLKSERSKGQILGRKKRINICRGEGNSYAKPTVLTAWQYLRIQLNTTSSVAQVTKTYMLQNKILTFAMIKSLPKDEMC